MLDHLARALPNFSKERAVRALRHRKSDPQIVWQREVVLCPSCGGTLDDVTSRQKERLPWDRCFECPRDGNTVRVGRQRSSPELGGRTQ